MSLNIQGLRNKTEEIDIWLKSQKYNLDALCMTETWLTSDELSLGIYIGELQLVSGFSRTNKRHGGVGIFIKKDLHYTVLKNIENLNKESDFECCAVSLDTLNTILVSIYRSPLGNMDIFFNSMNECLERIFKCNKQIIITGDFNINFMNLDNNVINFKNLLLSFNLKITISEPTRISRFSSTCIDNVATNIELYETKVIDTDLSDHRAILFSIPTPNLPMMETSNFRQLTEENLYFFEHFLSQENWTEIFNSNDVNTVYDNFLNRFLYAFNLFIPKTSKSIFKNKNYSKNWITPELQKMSEQKRLLFLLIKDIKINNTNIDENVHALTNKYKQICMHLKKNIVKQKQTFYNNEINNSKDKIKSSWQLVKRTGKNNNSKQYVTAVKKSDNNAIVNNPKEISEEFNHFFCNISQSLNLPTPNLNININSLQHSLFFRPTDSREVYNIIMSLKNKHSTGWDEIPVLVIKRCASIICEPLSKILNMTLESGIFPNNLKKAIIVPLYKKGSDQDISNYRPIALLPVFSKIFELAIKERLLSFINKNNIITEHQHGFVKNSSINVSIFKVIDNIINCWENKIPCSLALLDLTKAFDCVDKNLLLCKLEKYGVRGRALDLFSSYMTDRKQCVKIKVNTSYRIQESTSDWSSNNRGVPQGSILGPLLFILFINDLPLATENKTFLFADDTAVICEGRDQALLKERLEDCMIDLSKWFSSNSLKINNSKTEMIKFGNYFTIPQLSYKDSVKFLGIYIDSNLDWKKHINYILPKLNRAKFVLLYLKKYVSFDILLSVYHAYFQSIIQFGIIFWGNSAWAQKVFILQKKCICTRLKNYIKLPMANIDVYKFCPLNFAAALYNKLPVSFKIIEINVFKKKIKNFLLENAFYNVNEFIDYFK